MRAKNPAAVALGKLAAGVPKQFSVSELERRRKLMAGINARKRKASKAKKRRMPNESSSPTTRSVELK
jgi:hypothetical protein